MKSSPYTIHYGIGMLMNLEPLAYDTLKFEPVSSIVSLTESEIVQKGKLESILKNNKKLNSIVTKHLDTFPLFKIVSEKSTDEYYFKIKKQNKPTTHALNISVLKSARVHVVVEIEAGAEVTIIESMMGNAYAGYQLDLIAGKGSKVNYIAHAKVPDMRTILRNAYMAQDSSIVWHEAVIEGKLIQSHTRTYLYETGAQAEVKDVFALSSDTVLDMYHSMYHLASHTKSDMLTKGLLQGRSRALYQGLIHIDEKAIGCTGYQKEDSLVLSNNAEVNAVPNLEIENSDVKCSHGVTTAHIDKEKLFYMQSRGIDTKTATDLFVEGHLSPCLEQSKDEKIRYDILERIKENLMADRFPE